MDVSVAPVRPCSPVPSTSLKPTKRVQTNDLSPSGKWVWSFERSLCLLLCFATLVTIIVYLALIFHVHILLFGYHIVIVCMDIDLTIPTTLLLVKEI